MATVTDGSGTIIAEVAAGQYPFTPITPGQHNVAISSSAQGLTVPAGATYATVQVKNSAASYTTDGTTTPTTSQGMTLGVGATITLSGAQVIANFKIIGPSGCTMDAEFFK